MRNPQIILLTAVPPQRFHEGKQRARPERPLPFPLDRLIESSPVVDTSQSIESRNERWLISRSFARNSAEPAPPGRGVRLSCLHPDT